jgi:hypothetical protein
MATEDEGWQRCPDLAKRGREGLRKTIEQSDEITADILKGMICSDCGLPLDPEERRKLWPKDGDGQTCWECAVCGQSAWGIPDFDRHELTISELFRLEEEVRRQG